jgi:hypothetical protein
MSPMPLTWWDRLLACVGIRTCYRYYVYHDQHGQRLPYRLLLKTRFGRPVDPLSPDVRWMIRSAPMLDDEAAQVYAQRLRDVAQEHSKIRYMRKDLEFPGLLTDAEIDQAWAGRRPVK